MWLYNIHFEQLHGGVKNEGNLCFYCVLFTLCSRWHLSCTFCILYFAFCIPHSHANTSHQLIALAMPSATFSGRFALPRTSLPVIQSLDFGPVFLFFLALCIMRHVVQMKVKNTSGNFCLNPKQRLVCLLQRRPTRRPKQKKKKKHFELYSHIFQVPKQFVRLSACAFLGT